MRLEYTKREEAEMRIAEIEAILESHSKEPESIEDFKLEVEKQFLKDELNEVRPHEAAIHFSSGCSMMIFFFENVEIYSMIFHDKHGNQIGTCSSNSLTPVLTAGIDYNNRYKPMSMVEIRKRFIKENGSSIIDETDGVLDIANGNIHYLIVAPHPGNDQKWLLRVTTASAFDRWANSTVIEEKFNDADDLLSYIETNKADIYLKLIDYLSEEYDELLSSYRESSCR
jgi:hypothetical protein